MTTVDAASLLRPVLAEATSADRYFDYCLEPYRPRRPWQGKLRSESLLFASLHDAGARALEPPLRAIQRHVGRDLTIWGVKWDGRASFWELYFYDPRKESAEATVSSVAAAVAPWIRIVPEVRETIPYMMASFELEPATIESGVVSTVDLYLTGENAHAGRSYQVRAGGAELANTYRFFPPKRSIDELLPLLQSSAFVDYTDPRTLGQVLLPELFACKKICVAKKRTCDGIYFSGITVDQLEWFLRRLDYPEATRRLVASQRHRLDHLYFDVGIDYRQGPGGRIEHVKSSYYGTL